MQQHFAIVYRELHSNSFSFPYFLSYFHKKNKNTRRPFVGATRFTTTLNNININNIIIIIIAPLHTPGTPGKWLEPAPLQTRKTTNLPTVLRDRADVWTCRCRWTVNAPPATVWTRKFATGLREYVWKANGFFPSLLWNANINTAVFHFLLILCFFFLFFFLGFDWRQIFAYQFVRDGRNKAAAAFGFFLNYFWSAAALQDKGGNLRHIQKKKRNNSKEHSLYEKSTQCPSPKRGKRATTTKGGMGVKVLISSSSVFFLQISFHVANNVTHRIVFETDHDDDNNADDDDHNMAFWILLLELYYYFFTLLFIIHKFCGTYTDWASSGHQHIVRPFLLLKKSAEQKPFSMKRMSSAC